MGAMGKAFEEIARKNIDNKYGSGAYDSLGLKITGMGSVFREGLIVKAGDEHNLVSNRYKSQLESYRDKKGGIFTTGNVQGEDIGSSDVNNDSGVITRGSVLNYRDKQKRQGLFGNIGTILGN